MPKLHIVIASTRPGRVGPKVATWVHESAVRHGKLDAELVDLAEVNLPLLDEAAHPRLGKYEHAHTKAWSARVASADAFVFVTPEYNYGSPPSLINALDCLFHEWHYKPVGFVSYGGVSGGLRSVQMTKQICTTLRMMPIPEGVPIPFVGQSLDAAGRFSASAAQEKSAVDMFEEIGRWAEALAPLRARRA